MKSLQSIGALVVVDVASGLVVVVVVVGASEILSWQFVIVSLIVGKTESANALST